MNTYKIIGLMSGTSLDGLDIVYAEFWLDTTWHFDLKYYETISYDNIIENKLRQAYDTSGLDLVKADLEYGSWLGNNVRKFIEKNKLKPELVVSHGHTIFHQPDIGLTYQLGNGYCIMKECGVPVINDLRTLDVILGGQGAPLVPIGDRLLFADYEFCLNLGGFSNISFEHKDQRIAFDICPVNVVLNHFAQKMGLKYDDKGKLSQSGKLNGEILKRLNALEYYKKVYPKSLGIEWVNQHVFPLLENAHETDILHTFSHHIAIQINNIINDSLRDNKKVLVTGGGTKNDFLINLLKSYSEEKVQYIIPEESLSDFKEALIFAFLGLLRKLGITNTLKSVTGASHDSIGGVIYDNLNL